MSFGYGTNGRRMSRLDSFIRRLTAQRACLEHCVQQTALLTGPIVELGLGNGRTFDHLRELAPEREIFVLERNPQPHPDCMPDEGRLIVGELKDTLRGLRQFLHVPAVLLHCDIGCGRPEVDRETASLISRHISDVLSPGAWVASDQRLDAPGLAEQQLPEGVRVGRYFVYRWNS